MQNNQFDRARREGVLFEALSRLNRLLGLAVQDLRDELSVRGQRWASD